MSTITPAALDLDLDAHVPTARKSKFELGAEIDLPGRKHESVATGTGRDGIANCVHISGAAQNGVPGYAVSAWMASGRCISPASVVRSFIKAGTLKDLEAAIAAAKKPAA